MSVAVSESMPLNENEWLVSKAVVRGKSHIDKDTPCQDFCDVRTSADGRWVVAVVCDGAGSARKSDVGARVVATDVTSALIDATDEIEERGPGAWLKDYVYDVLIEVRKKLRESGDSIYDFHCTLVGVLIGRSGGFFFHLGDGLALAGKARCVESQPGVREVSLWNDMLFSEPENGEYANETFFVTQDDWIKHLRALAIPGGCDIVALMSDGTMPFVFQNNGPYSPFIDPVVSRLIKTLDREERDNALHEILASPETYRATDDDKTLFVAVRKELRGLAFDKIMPFKPAALKKNVEGRTIRFDDMNTTINNKHGALAIILSVSALILALVSVSFNVYFYVYKYPSVAAPSRPADGRTEPNHPTPDESRTDVEY